MLDTNVVVSALLWGGVPYRLLQAATAGDLVLFTSPVLLDELRTVLARPHLASRLTQQRSSIERAIGHYGELALVVTPSLTPPRVVPTDPDDDHVIACALAARADLIVSGDRDLLALGAYEDIRIVNASAAVALIESAPRP